VKHVVTRDTATAIWPASHLLLQVSDASNVQMSSYTQWDCSSSLHLCRFLCGGFGLQSRCFTGAGSSKENGKVF